MNIDNDAGTRDRILTLIIEKGPITSAELAQMLVLTAAAVRRHLSQLEYEGQITEYAGASSRPARRGRPSRRYVATDQGQAAFGDSYGDVAMQALQFVQRSLGDAGIKEFAEERIKGLEERYRPYVEAAGEDLEARAMALARVLTHDGYAASVRKGPRGLTLQLCQGHCPIHDVAAAYPTMCEAETQAFHRLLGVHVQRLATLAGGEHVCTLTIPLVSRMRGTQLEGKP
ncbi:MAG: winged helix-turn-helix transcriptional regulator [Ancrocorticia sp.]|jgi:predicted ArsR family transcriptional regulator|nr:winged helix-turn-helix transcriptional regulator [Ancrocorticia sp.]